MPTDERAATRANLSEAKRALLERRLAGKGAPLARAQAIPRACEPGVPAELSYSQESALEAAREEGRPSFYNIVVSFAGRLDADALCRTLNALVVRHEALRTTFDRDGDRAFQLVQPAEPFEIPLTDLSGLAPDEREACAHRAAVEHGEAPFDLARGPLFRVRLLRMGEAEHRLLLAIAHVACDLWSLGILTRELAVVYEAFSCGRPSPLQTLAVGYTDFALWQRRRFEVAADSPLLGYWKRQLADAPEQPPLPQGRPRVKRTSTSGAHESLTMPAWLTPMLDAVGHRASATRFMTVLAAFYALLHRYTGQEDILVGSASAGRNRPELEGLIGCFINMMMLRTKLSAGNTFLELLASVRAVVLEAFMHQEAPFALVAAEAETLTRFNFILHNDTGERLKVPGLSISSYMIDTGRTATDLTLSVQETPAGLAATFEYDSDLFTREAVAGMLLDLQRLLACVAEDPEHTLSRLPISAA